MPAKDKRQQPDDEDQSRAFIEKARELGADKDDIAADELVRRLAKTPPDPHKKTN